MQEERIPTHVAIIMDGNGRWAKARLMPRSAGHHAGMKRLRGLAEYIFSRGVKYITLYALSTENLSRPKEEVEGLFSLFRNYFLDYVKPLKEKSIRVKILGDRTALPEDVQEKIAEGEALTADGTRGQLTFAVNYGARQELLRAVNTAVKSGKELSMEDLSSLLYTKDMPDPDLVIRTGKELRLSNFLLFQSAYSELYFSDKMFPDFSDEDMEEALRSYALRERRFGKVK